MWCMCMQVLAPGLRIGWVTAAPKLVERIIYHMQGIHLGANSFTQASALAGILCCSLEASHLQGSVFRSGAGSHVCHVMSFCSPD